MLRKEDFVVAVLHKAGSGNFLRFLLSQNGNIKTAQMRYHLKLPFLSQRALPHLQNYRDRASAL